MLFELVKIIIFSKWITKDLQYNYEKLSHSNILLIIINKYISINAIYKKYIRYLRIC